MKANIKKVLSMFLVLSMIMTLVPSWVFAEKYADVVVEPKNDNVERTIENLIGLL